MARAIFSLEAQFRQVDLLRLTTLSSATYYYWRRRFQKVDPDQKLKRAIQAIAKANPHYGVRRVYLSLRRKVEYATINHKRVQRMMKLMGLQGQGYRRKTRKYSSYLGPRGLAVKNRLHRRFKADRPYQKLVTDVTEFKLPINGEKLYLEPIMDLYNNEILTYNLSNQPNLAFAIKPLKDLIERLPYRGYQSVLHSDQGWQYRHRIWQKLAQRAGLKPSMSRKATALDNAAMESFFHKLKIEIGPLKAFQNKKELKKAIQHWITYYNETRLQAKLGGLSPIEYRQQIA
ncbi:IS3 family transposase [Convivina intestini]|uniref:IS3 family transposase n=1 Tax=Convivina intestini TaxID=1505726 RepID=UPI00200C1C6E|nr:IS3 family transposase [Convivina intestini]CAH1851520.1 IS3 family transposase ISWci1 [Convivina intestini]